MTKKKGKKLWYPNFLLLLEDYASLTLYLFDYQLFQDKDWLPDKNQKLC